MKFPARRTLLLAPLVFLVCFCCGGGGGEGGGSERAIQPQEAPLSPLPVANAGPDQAITEGQSVVLNASQSTGQGALTFLWTIVNRPPDSMSALVPNNTVGINFTPDSLGTYTISLMVTDDQGRSSEPDEVVVDVVSISTTVQVTLAWDPSISETVLGYRVYYGTASRNYAHVLDAGNVTTYTVPGLVRGVQYYFAVTAYASSEESAFSNEVSCIRPVEND